MAVKVGRSDQAQAAAIAHSGSLAGETRVTDAALDAAGVIRCRDLDELLETAELVEGVRRTGRRVGRGRTGVVTVSTGEASLIADLVPRTGVDLPPIPPAARAAILEALPTMGYIGNPLDPWGAADAGDGIRRPLRGDGRVGRLRRARPRPRLPVPLAAVGGRDGQRGDAARSWPRPRDRPAILPVYVSLTSGEPPPETKALLDGDGRRRAAPARRASRRSGRSPRSPAGRRRHERARRPTGRGGRAGRRWRPTGPRTARTRAPTRRPARPPRGPVRAREPGPPRGGRDRGHRGRSPSTDAAAAVVGAARRIGRPVALKLDAVGLAHKSDVGGVALGLRGDDAVYARRPDAARDRAGATG